VVGEKRNLILNIYKEENIPSFEIVRGFRRRFKERKCGFLGTLDPFASGVLPIFSGDYTKLIHFLEDSEKKYLAVIQFGILTDTFDFTGKILKKKSIPSLEKEEIEKMIEEHFKGERNQIIPPYSATKINGVRSYKIARKGVQIEKRKKMVKLIDFKIINFDKEFLEIELLVKKGFYVRSFAIELAERFDNYATVVKLKRLKNCFFEIDESKSIEEITEFDTYNPEEILKNFYKKIKVEEKIFERLTNGQIVKMNGFENGIYFSVKKGAYMMIKIKDGYLYPVRYIK